MTTNKVIIVSAASLVATGLAVMSGVAFNRNRRKRLLARKLRQRVDDVNEVEQDVVEQVADDEGEIVDTTRKVVVERDCTRLASFVARRVRSVTGVLSRKPENMRVALNRVNIELDELEKHGLRKKDRMATVHIAAMMCFVPSLVEVETMEAMSVKPSTWERVVGWFKTVHFETVSERIRAHELATNEFHTK